jgi:hypothetical protein
LGVTASGCAERTVLVPAARRGVAELLMSVILPWPAADGAGLCSIC